MEEQSISPAIVGLSVGQRLSVFSLVPRYATRGRARLGKTRAQLPGWDLGNEIVKGRRFDRNNSVMLGK